VWYWKIQTCVLFISISTNIYIVVLSVLPHILIVEEVTKNKGRLLPYTPLSDLSFQWRQSVLSDSQELNFQILFTCTWYFKELQMSVLTESWTYMFKHYRHALYSQVCIKLQHLHTKEINKTLFVGLCMHILMKMRVSM
jgi:hypothetical protein